MHYRGQHLPCQQIKAIGAMLSYVPMGLDLRSWSRKKPTNRNAFLSILLDIGDIVSTDSGGKLPLPDTIDGACPVAGIGGWLLPLKS